VTARSDASGGRELLFVYGSLKRGHSNHAQLSGAEFCGEAQTAAGYALYGAGAYPALAEEGQGRVRGELYAVPLESFGRLDEFECCPWLYERRRIRLSDGRPAQAYLLPAARRAECRECLGESWP
jgi:gamma-glutamylcyclotransferase (GGCT)/AIG2-like uncharacterized protein YtfP